MKLVLKLIIAILLLLCLADMPYGFYEMVRFIAAGAFAYMAYDYYRSNHEGLGFVFAGLALLFQPFLKVALGRTIWNAVDVIVAIALFGLIVKSLNIKK